MAICKRLWRTGMRSPLTCVEFEKFTQRFYRLVESQFF